MSCNDGSCGPREDFREDLTLKKMILNCKNREEVYVNMFSRGFTTKQLGRGFEIYERGKNMVTVFYRVWGAENSEGSFVLMGSEVTNVLVEVNGN